MATGDDFTIRGSRLTPAEGEILKHLLTRASNQDIARELGCTIKNVEFHVSNILKKAGEKSRLGLVIGLIEPARKNTLVPGRPPDRPSRRPRGR